jgi:hypothetical protein
MKLQWVEEKDRGNPEQKCCGVEIAGGWLRAYVEFTRTEDDLPWDARISGSLKGHSLIGYGSMEEAKQAVEAILPEIIEEIRSTLDDS